MVLVVAALLGGGCAEKFELPPTPEGSVPFEGAYNFEYEWRDMGRVRDMVLAGEVLYLLTDRNGEMRVEAYAGSSDGAAFAQPTPFPLFSGHYDGLRRPVALASRSAGERYLWIADQKGPDALIRTQECGSGDCYLRLAVDPDGTDRQLAARTFAPLSTAFDFSFRLRLETLPAETVRLVLGSAVGRIGVWLEVTPGGYLRARKPDGTVTDSLAFGAASWHDVDVAYDFRQTQYVVRVDETVLEPPVPIYQPLEEPFSVFSLRFAGAAVTGGVDRIRLIDQGRPGALVINEISLTDTLAQFVEIKGPAGFNLGVFELIGINSDTTEVEQYRTVRLLGTIPDDGYFVLASSSSVPGADQIAAGVWQRGDDGYVDALRLRDRLSGQIRDLLCYGGPIDEDVVCAEGPPAPIVGPGSALARCPDGSDSDRNASDFFEDPTPTPGAVNDVCDPVRLALDFESADEVNTGWSMGPYFTNDPSPIIHRYLSLEGGRPVQSYTGEDWFTIEGIALDDDLTLFVSGQERNPADPYGVQRQAVINRFDRLGNRLVPLAIDGSGVGFVRQPRGVYFQLNGSGLLVADAELNRAQKFDVGIPPVIETVVVPPLGNTDISLSGPRDVVSDENELIYIADTGNDRVLRFEPTGAFADTVYSLTHVPTLGAGIIHAPVAIEADADEVWIADPEGERIVIVKKSSVVGGG